MSAQNADSVRGRIATAWRRFRHRLYRDRPGWRKSPWAGGDRYWYEPDDGWPTGPLSTPPRPPISPIVDRLVETVRMAQRRHDMAEVERLTGLLDEVQKIMMMIAELHKEAPLEAGWCACCGANWPCQTNKTAMSLFLTLEGHL